jgi:CheY-like chemotaxis protein
MSTTDAPQPGPTVLVVDDDPAVLAMLRLALARKGFAVLAAEGGEAAVELLRTAPGPVGVALLDVRMPGLDGPATLAALRQIDPGLPCCFMTGHAGGRGDDDLRATGAAVIHKPFAVADLADTLRGLLASGG